jgi:plasmid stabilization system protein ParE
MDVEFLDIAEYELDDAFKYYEKIHTGLGHRFVYELEKSITRMVLNPRAWQTSSVFTHRCLINRFPYSIIYQIRTDVILIIAVACHHQKPNYWIKRVGI